MSLCGRAQRCAPPAPESGRPLLSAARARTGTPSWLRRGSPGPRKGRCAPRPAEELFFLFLLSCEALHLRTSPPPWPFRDWRSSPVDKVSFPMSVEMLKLSYAVLKEVPELRLSPHLPVPFPPLDASLSSRFHHRMLPIFFFVNFFMIKKSICIYPNPVGDILSYFCT